MQKVQLKKEKAVPLFTQHISGYSEAVKVMGTKVILFLRNCKLASLTFQKNIVVSYKADLCNACCGSRRLPPEIPTYIITP